MPTLQQSWDALLAEEPDDWSHLACEVGLDDPERMEEAALLACSLNPWHGETWRTGLLRFRVARQHGYGASNLLTRAILGRLDEARIGGEIRIAESVEAVAQVSTQGPTF